MYKHNSFMAIIKIPACMMVLLLCACSSFQPPQSINTSAIGQNTAVFRGKILAPHEDGKSSYALARAFQARHKHRLAIEAFKDVISGDPGNAAAYNGLGVSLDAVGDFDQAVKAYAAALSIDPDLAYVLNNLGYSYLLQGRMNLAIESFKKAIQLDDNSPRYQNNLGLAYARSGKHDDALQTFKSVGDDASAHLKMGRFFYRNGYYEEAEVHLSWASVLKPADPDIRKASQANACLAQIHASDQIQAAREKALPLQIEETPLFDHDTGGFYTIPAGAIHPHKTVEIKRIDISPNNYLAANEIAPLMARPDLLATPDVEAKPTAPLNTVGMVIFEKTNEKEVLNRLNMESADIKNKPRTRVKIEVANGNGIRHMARDVGNFLKDRKVTLMYLSNANSFDHDETIIYYVDGYLHEAYCISQRLPEQQRFEQVSEIRAGQAEISVVLGRDLVAHLDLFRKE